MLSLIEFNKSAQWRFFFIRDKSFLWSSSKTNCNDFKPLWL